MNSVIFEKEKRVILLLPLCKEHLVWLSKAVNKRSALQPLFFLSTLEVAWSDAPGVFLWNLPINTVEVELLLF